MARGGRRGLGGGLGDDLVQHRVEQRGLALEVVIERARARPRPRAGRPPPRWPRSRRGRTGGARWRAASRAWPCPARHAGRRPLRAEPTSRRDSRRAVGLISSRPSVGLYRRNGMQTSALDTVQVDGLEIGYRELGEGPPVLLLHGWPTSSHLWRDVMPAIARANRVIAPDLPGFGVSDKPARRDLRLRALRARHRRAARGARRRPRRPRRPRPRRPDRPALDGPQPGARDRARPAQHARLPAVRAFGDRVRRHADDARQARAGDEPGGAGAARAGRDASRLRAPRRADRGGRGPIRHPRVAESAGGRRRRPRLRGLRRDRAEAARADDARADRLRRGRPGAPGRGRDDGAGGARPAPGGRHRAAGPRALHPGGGARSGGRAAGGVLRRARPRPARPRPSRARPWRPPAAARSARSGRRRPSCPRAPR